MTTQQDNNPFPQEAADILREQMEAQPWYKRFSNTVTSAVGFIVVSLWFAASAGWEVPENVTMAVTSGIMLLTTLGVLRTPNGVTPRGLKATEEYAGKHRSE